MASSPIHPRRRPVSPSLDDLSDSFRAISLRKGSTFHPAYRNTDRSIFEQFRDPKIPSLPARSTTCPKALEDLLIGAGERRAVDLLRKVDKAIAGGDRLSNILSEPEVLPVPRFMVKNAQPAEDNRPIKQETCDEEDAHHHRSDSGIGSSLAESAYQKLQTSRATVCSSASVASSAVTQSYSGNPADDTAGLSTFAQQQIHKFIVAPILREPSLKEFHPLIRDVPSRIHVKEIRTLRDLEKTLIFLAPDYSRSPAAYRSFCETSIRCLHLTVDTVHESDQCLPADRPYTTGYFVDLVEQIRRYAAILAATRAKQERGEELNEMDATPYVNQPGDDADRTMGNPDTINRADRIELQGGVSHNGKAAFLTVTKDGRNFTNLADNTAIPAAEAVTMTAKRPIEAAVDDDGARRSMARRKKDAPILTYHCRQPGCKKTFKRPCDLTKHDKTHDRPFKCPDSSCKYHIRGWPTEKECDRHFNDKHSEAPKLYSCEFTDCPYTSKRESNCKQHMEKSHGWQYTRSKNNGKGSASSKGKSKAVVTVSAQSASPSNSGLDGSTPLSSIQPSPLTTGSSDFALADTAVPYHEQSVDPYTSTLFDFGGDFAGHFNTDFLGNGVMSNMTPAWTDDQHISTGSSTHQSPFNNQFDTTLNMGNDFQQLTPSSSNQDIKDLSTHAHPDSAFLSGTNPPLNTFTPHVSPSAGDLMFTDKFYDDNMQIDEGCAFVSDFQLFEGHHTSNATPLFTEGQDGLGNMGSQFESRYGNGDFDVRTLFPELD